MKIYWRWRDVPELAGLSRSERRKVVQDCFFRFGFGLWQFWVGQLAIFIFAVLGGIVGVTLRYGFGLPRAVELACGLVGVLTGCLIYGWIYYTVLVDRLRPHFREYLQSHGV